MVVNKTTLAKALIQTSEHLAMSDIAGVERAVAPYVDELRAAVEDGHTQFTVPMLGGVTLRWNKDPTGKAHEEFSF